MELIDKERFIAILKLNPQLLIGREIIIGRKSARINDISICGDCLMLEYTESSRIEWISTELVGNVVVIDKLPKNDTSIKPFTVSSVTRRILSLENRMGSDSDQSKPLFVIVASLNKEILELRLKIEEMESKLEEMNKYRPSVLPTFSKIEEMEPKLEEMNNEPD